MAIRAIFFDAGNTLVWLDHPFLVEALREAGHACTEDQLMEAEYEVKLLLDEMARNGRGLAGPERGRMYFSELFRRVGLPDDRFPPLGQRLFARHAERNLWSRVRERTLETLDELRRRGFRLAVISNADGRVEALLEQVGLRSPFEFVIDSQVVGLEKPDPRIFRLGLERAGVEPEQAAYVGDIYEIDVVGARAAGMRPFLIDPLGRFGALECERIASLEDLPELLGEAA